MIDYQTRFNKNTQIKVDMAKAEDDGEISGYAAIFDEQDLDGDVIRKGAFDRSIKNQIAAGKVMLLAKHFRDGGDAYEVVGKIVEAREDNIGLWVRAKLSTSEMAQKVRYDVLLAPDAYGMSVGWRNVENGAVPLPNGKGYEYREMNLKEVTITLRPAQESTVGTVKAKTAEALEDRIARIEVALERLQTKSSSLADTESVENASETGNADNADSAEAAADDDSEIDIDELDELERSIQLLKARRKRYEPRSDH